MERRGEGLGLAARSASGGAGQVPGRPPARRADSASLAGAGASARFLLRSARRRSTEQIRWHPGTAGPSSRPARGAMPPPRPPGRCQRPLDGVNGRRPLPQAGSAGAGSACRKLARPAAAQAQPDGVRRARTRLADLRVRPARRGRTACAELRQEPWQEPGRAPSGSPDGCAGRRLPAARSAGVDNGAPSRQKGQGRGSLDFLKTPFPPGTGLWPPILPRRSPVASAALARITAPACPPHQARTVFP